MIKKKQQLKDRKEKEEVRRNLKTENNIAEVLYIKHAWQQLLYKSTYIAQTNIKKDIKFLVSNTFNMSKFSQLEGRQTLIVGGERVYIHSCC